LSRPVVVLGAGPAGIGAALALGNQATVLERGNSAAGLSRSIVLDGAVFDLGGHSFHTPHPHVRELVFGALEMEEQRRNAWCWIQGNWIAYPFQKHVGDIADPALRAACIAGMAAASDGRDAMHFDAYIEARFGNAVADVFMRPYNRKLWGQNLSRLTKDWTGERVAGPLGQPEHFVQSGGNRTPLQAETTIAYPAQGGFGGIFDALAQRLTDLRFGCAVVAIDPMARVLTTRCGQSFGWEQLVSTLPLPALLDIVAGIPAHIRQAAALLEPIPVDLVMVALEGRGPMERQRIYCPDADMPGHKIVLNHTSSNWLRGCARHGIQVEVSGAARPPEKLVDRVVENLVRIGLIGNAGEVRRAEVIKLAHGYPAPTHARDRVIRDVRDWLAARGIYICGRFAEWAYINADEALARGLNLGQRLDAGVLDASGAEYA
jgi:UDP-galactopyranose mutase